MRIIQEQSFDQERAFYGESGLRLERCRFEGPADGESACKECQSITATQCLFQLRYPFWHDRSLTIEECEMTELCRAALWYCEDVTIRSSRLHGIKALRECSDVRLHDCDILSAEFGWFCRSIEMTDCTAQSEYFMLRGQNLSLRNTRLRGKYAFQYITDSEFDACNFDTKDVFWHAKNVTVKNSVIKGEYAAWYCENVTFENCTIIGTQPFCYCKNLRLINCTMLQADLSFERSQVEAILCAPIDSVKNVRSGFVYAPEIGQIISDDPDAAGRILTASTQQLPKTLLRLGGFTCVICKEDQLYTSTLRGVKPLVQYLRSGTDLQGAAAADRVVGKATAFLYVLLGVREVSAAVMSEAAQAVLLAHGIGIAADCLVPNIINRRKDGICPFEEAVLHIDSPQEALKAIELKMQQLGITI